MRSRLNGWRRWSSEHYVAVGAVVVLVAGAIGAWDMLHTGVIARFAEGTGADEPSSPQIPLVAIGLVAGAVGAWLVGLGRPLRWRAGTFVVVGGAAMVAWLPGIVLFVLAFAVLASLHLL